MKMKWNVKQRNLESNNLSKMEIKKILMVLVRQNQEGQRKPKV